MLTSVASPAPWFNTRTGHDLALLQQADLIRTGEPTLQGEYRFKHSLIQEATYGSLVREQRRSLHRIVAEVILQLQPDIAEVRPEILALHYLHAGDDRRAFDYGLRAGNMARAGHAYEEAIASFDLALKAAPSLPAKENAQRIRDVYLGKGAALEFSGRHAEARSNFESLLTFAIEAGEPSLEAEALNRLATAALMGSDRNVDVEELLERALERARQSGDTLLVARTLWNRGLRHRFSDPLQADELFGQALEIIRSPACRALPPESGTLEVEGHILIDLMVSHMTSGRRQQGIRHGLEALAAFELLDNQPMTADALAGLALLQHFGGDFDEAVAKTTEGRRISKRIENPWGITYNGWIALAIMADRAEYSKALRFSTEIIEVSLRVPFVGFRSAIHGILSTIHLDLGQLQKASEHAGRMTDAFDGWTETAQGWEAWARGIQARVSLAQDDPQTASELLRPYRDLGDGVIPIFQDYYIVAPSIAWLDHTLGETERGIHFASQIIARLRHETTDRTEAEMLYWRGRLYALAGSPAEAEADYRRALSLLERSGARALEWPVHAELAAILAEHDDAAEATQHRNTAIELLRSIADDLEDPNLRDSFLRRPAVAALLGSHP